MPETDLLTTYANAVQRMRMLQRIFGLNPTPKEMDHLLAAEKEVDELTTLHLLPSLAVLDFMPLLREGQL